MNDYAKDYRNYGEPSSDVSSSGYADVMFERDKERPNILGQIQGKEVTDHEIFGLDSDGYCDVAYRGTFHGGNANTVTLALKIRKMLGVLFERDGGV